MRLFWARGFWRVAAEFAVLTLEGAVESGGDAEAGADGGPEGAFRGGGGWVATAEDVDDEEEQEYAGEDG